MALQSPSTADTPSFTLTEHRALIFDVYGTLIDWESAIHDALAPVFPDLPRKEILVNYSGVEGNLQTQFQRMPYSGILELAYRQLTTPTGVTQGELRLKEQRGCNVKEDVATPSTSPRSDDATRFGRSIPDWKPFPDTIDALHRLKKHFALVVLSNVDDQSFAGTHAKLCNPDYPGSAYRTVTPDSPFSLVFTAQQVGAYKPNPLMLGCALRQLSANPDPSLPSNPSVHVDASEVLVVANSLRHDIIPAMEHKLRSVWISRHGVNLIGNESNVALHSSDQEGATAGGKHPYTWRYETLGTMADAVEGEVPK
ncbi:HAD-like domain-containing protein [Boletus edulis BED1]|uniref:HAD-like domain-containing protein n=1 Tax=Boletus edulis BED1 TaxID=1328754 RepID=A0AAD4GDV5_BOLED|nr:HAD-like domain-containing protein [Boletus edulis BED1]